MKELLAVPDTVEMKALFTSPVQRILGIGDKAQDKIWLNYFSTLTGRHMESVSVDHALLISEAVSRSIAAPKIESLLRNVSNILDLEKAIIEAGASFHIRYVESEYRLSINPNLGSQLFDATDHKPVNFDIYGPTQSTRVRFSPEFKQTKLNVKIPLQEGPDGKRTRLKFEYRGDPPGNDDFVDALKSVALRFLSDGASPFVIKQSVEIVKRDKTNLPVWINRQLILDNQYREILENKDKPIEEKLALLNNILSNPEKHTRLGDEYWMEVDAGDESELKNNMDSYMARCSSDQSKKIISSAKTIK